MQTHSCSHFIYSTHASDLAPLHRSARPFAISARRRRARAGPGL